MAGGKDKKQWYPYDQLGAMYVHTNYLSFQSNIGSFGDHSGELENQFIEAIARQIEREEKIDALLKEILGVGIDDYIGYIEKWFKEYEKHIGEAFINVDVRGKKKMGDILKVAYDADIQKGLSITQAAVDSTIDLLNQISEKGYINMENLESVEKRMKTLLESIETTVEESGGKDSDKLRKSLRGSVLSLKGIVWEAFIISTTAAFFQHLTKNKNFVLTATGEMAGGKAKADLLAELGKVKLPISIKSTNIENFQKYGIYTHHGTFESILNIVEKYPLGSAHTAVEQVKYYLINVSRMLAHPLQRQKGQGGLANVASMSKLIRSLLSTYLTVFIGDSHLAEEANISEDVMRADILITKDRVFRKSILLYGTYTKADFLTYLKPEYKHDSTDYWELFDQFKRNRLFETRGNYADSELLSFVRPYAQKLLQQKASIRLRMISKD